ncbi:MAG: hypothetical protein WC969_04640 [Elusimicrobiota bacterium]|jgi:endoglucanase
MTPPIPALGTFDAGRALGILASVLREPTAPYFEHRVRATIRRALETVDIPCRIDAHGNLVAHYRRGKAFPVAFTAHMDHPGFEVLSVSGRTAQARWNGQVPVFDLKGLKLALWPSEPGAIRHGTAVVLKGDGRKPAPGNAELLLKVPEGTKPGFFGHADLPLFELSEDLIRSKAHDDLAGCGAVVATLDHLARRRLEGDVLAVFTRAEEVGFKGALGAVKSRLIPRERPVVVLECSKALPGIPQGGGAVVRVGDKMSVFDADLASSAFERAKELQAARGTLWQRKLMDGGTCEATAFGLAGYRAICLALPLGNYHNNGPRGVAVETIHRRDFLGSVELLTAFAAGGLDPLGARRRLNAWLQGRLTAADERRLKRGRCCAMHS